MEYSTVIIVGLANNFQERDHHHRLGRDRDRGGADAVASLARFFKVPWLRRTLRDFQFVKIQTILALLRSDRDQPLNFSDVESRPGIMT